MTEQVDNRQLLAFVPIAVGVLWSLSPGGSIPTRFLAVGLAWWPLLAIGLGPDLLAVRRLSPRLPYVVGGTGAMALPGLPAPQCLSAGVGTEAFTGPLGGAARARIEWENPGFREGTRGLSVIIEDAGSGSSTIR